MGFFTKYKKILFLIVFILIVIALGYLIYFLFFKPVPSEPPVAKPPVTATPRGLPVAEVGPGQIVTPTEEAGFPIDGAPTELASSKVASGGLTQTKTLNNIPSLGATISSNGSDLQYYNIADGKFYRIDKNGNLSALSDEIFHSVENVTWSPNKNKAILEYPDGANTVYDFSTDKQVTLPSHWKDFDFSPSGDQIVMKSMGLDPNNRWLAIVNDDGTKSRAIESLGEKDATVYPSWSPNNQTIAMYTEGVSFDRQEVFFVGLNNENFKSTIIEGRGFQPKWQPSGEKLLYSVYSSDTDLKPNLWIVNANGENIGSGRKNLNIETWADKCAFADNTSLYCAVPKNLEQGAGLFPELAQNTTDNLYKIDTRTGVKKLVAVPDGNYNMSNIIISDNGYNLYFTDESSGRLYTIKLK